jgi:transmembrane sensor
MKGLATPEEQAEFNQLMGDPANQEQAAELIRRAYSETDINDGNLVDMSPETSAAIFESIIRSDTKGKIPIRPISSFRLSWVAAVAVTLILISSGTYFFLTKKSSTAIVKNEKPAIINDIAPGTIKAILYLPTGQQIMLDSAKNGELAKLGNTIITKTDSGKLLYTSNGKIADADETSFNELRTPRGGIYQITLPDGTSAWLNASSSITYPTRFDEKQREVRITGEVYFEVAHDAAHPFLVSLPAKTRDQGENGHWMQIEVLGTHFNVNNYGSYDDGPSRTTLLEGSIKISAHGQTRLIRPGEQAATSFTSKSIEINNKVDLEKVMAWKNGEMSLTNSTVQQIMQEISRWYDVDIKYAGTIPDKKFYGTIDRNVPLSTVLNGLKSYGVETKLEGKTIIVQ